MLERIFRTHSPLGVGELVQQGNGTPQSTFDIYLTLPCLFCASSAIYCQGIIGQQGLMVTVCVDT